jgi:arylformamidase
MSNVPQPREWIDVTRPIRNGMIQWPGERPFAWSRSAEITGPGTCNVSEITTCVHVGTHIDAPLHFIPDGNDIDQIPLARLCGPALVVEMFELRDIQAADLAGADVRSGDGVLFKTANAELWNKDVFDTGFWGISSGAAEWLVKRGVRAIGVDYLSVDRYDSKDKVAHYALLGAGVVVIEGLDLAAVAPGRYEMVALPLRVPGADGSPARVILRPA